MAVTRLVIGVVLALGSANAAAQGSGTIEQDGTVLVPAFRLPPSVYVSDEAKRAMPRTPTDPEAPMLQMLAGGQAGAMRARVGEFMKPRHDALKAKYAVVTRETTIAGIAATIATPAVGVPTGNKRKVLLNLPGGGFVMGAANGTGLVESIPLAGLAGVEIVSITYRQAPEAVFPAASEDVAKVYRELLKTHRAQDIAVFGCSAGGLLAAEAMAWFVQEKLPLPGAIGIFCASADARWGGDSRAYARPFQALPAADGPRRYFTERDLSDPRASPVLSPALLAKFPPTLLITGVRAFELSAAVNTHRELVKAGVEADLHVWDGLGHAFFYDPALPESREAFDVMTRFFTRHLLLAKNR